MTMSVIKHVHELPEEVHPFLKSVTMKTMLSNRDEGAHMRYIIVSCPKGSEIEEQVHTEQDDVIFMPQGEAKIGSRGRESTI